MASVKLINTGYYHYAEITPVGVGTATITITDQYGQSADVSVKVTQKFVDESKYYRDLSFSVISTITYGETKIYCYCDIDANVYTIIDGKKYTGSVDEDGYYVIKKIPKLPAGTKVTVYFQKGQAIFEDTTTVERKGQSELSGTISTQTYTGKALKPSVTVKDGKSILKAGTDYTVKYSKNKNVGKGKATITFKGNYKGAKAVYFTINPKPTKITKIVGLENGFKVKWKKQTTQTDGYQIQYCRNKTFRSGKKTLTISNNTIASKKVAKLKANKKYYVRIRTYKVVGKTKYYSSWSPVKTVTIKG